MSNVKYQSHTGIWEIKHKNMLKKTDDSLMAEADENAPEFTVVSTMIYNAELALDKVFTASSCRGTR